MVFHRTALRPSAPRIRFREDMMTLQDSSGPTGKVAVVVGAGSGIGAAAVVALAANGWSIAAIDQNLDAARAVVDAAGDRHAAFRADISREAEVIEAFAAIARTFGRVDGLAACAGVSDSTPFLDLDADTFARMFAINATGTFLAMREAVKLMPDGGRICTVSSVAGLRGGGVFGTAAYAASKGAIIALTKTAARTLAPRQITVNCLVPGPVQTPMLDAFWGDEAQRRRVEGMIPLGRPGRAAEVASAITWMFSPEAAFLTGSTVVVDGGMSMY
ncbi:SDR family oxidoreductase [Xanthobacter sp. KR7-225]|uniref:SDR family NAD(P)-dependent oxidoreductase n=1 Tax=Xanthobacter sp. KR7-225 TaxID=3156613 RepID=UPI0032B562E4